MQLSVGPHLGARLKDRAKFPAIFDGWTKVQPYTLGRMRAAKKLVMQPG
jgi:hypothetical protein